jgi:hypothetical protein
MPNIIIRTAVPSDLEPLANKVVARSVLYRKPL